MRSHSLETWRYWRMMMPTTCTSCESGVDESLIKRRKTVSQRTA